MSQGHRDHGTQRAGVAFVVTLHGRGLRSRGGPCWPLGGEWMAGRPGGKGEQPVRVQAAEPVGSFEIQPVDVISALG